MKNETSARAGDRTIRVFISSTFRDMHAERDVLVTVAFPELRERLDRLGLDFVDVDLRWGVPQTGVDGERANSWAYCKQWIERVEPFFVCLLGQRYGWVPPADDIRDADDRAAYEGLSITDMEVRYAVLSGTHRRRSFFYLRGTEVPRDATPDDIYEVFVGIADQPRLQALKAAIGESGRPVRPYPCRWTGAGFTDLDKFGEMVLEDLWSGVLRDERYVSKDVWRAVLGHGPDDDPIYTDDSTPIPRETWERIVERARPTPADPLDAEAVEMAAFAAGRLRWFQGRTDELQQLRAFIDGTPPANASRVCVVRAVAGAGKSALLAKLAGDLAASLHMVVTHFVGATERSADARSMLERLVAEVDRHGIPHPEEKDAKQDLESLRARFASRLEPSEGTRRVVLLIDGVNQLTDGHEMSWLPQRLGAGVRIVLSCIDDPAAPETSPQRRILAALEQRLPRPEWLPLRALEESDVREIVDAFLLEYCKELDGKEKDTIAAMEQPRNPLYLLVMLHELRALGGQDMHVKVREIIKDLPTQHPDTVSLFDWVLERLEVLGVEEMRRWWIYLSLGRVGMSGRELSDLLGRAFGSDGAKRALRIERSVRRYLQRRGAQWDFFHGQLREAALRRYGPTDPIPYDADIAAYLETRWRVRERHAISELPYHQTRAKRWDALETTLCDLAFIAAKCGEGMTFDLLRDYDKALASLPERDEGRDMQRWRSALVLHADVCRTEPALVFNHFYYSLASTHVAPLRSDFEKQSDAVLAESAATRQMPWLCVVESERPQSPIIWHRNAHDRGIKSLSLSHAGALLVSSGEDGAVRLWQTNGGTAEATLLAPNPSVNRSARISSNGSVVVAIVDWGRRLCCWDLSKTETSCRSVLENAEGQLSDELLVNALGTEVVIGPRARAVNFAVVDLKTGQLTDRRDLPDFNILSLVLAATHDLSRVVIANWHNSGLWIWDRGRRKNRFVHIGSELSHTSCIAITPQGDTIVAGTIYAGGSARDCVSLLREDPQALSWEAVLLGVHGERVKAVDITPDGRWVASAGDDGVVSLWDTSKTPPERVSMRLPQEAGFDILEALAIDARGETLFAGGANGRIVALQRDRWLSARVGQSKSAVAPSLLADDAPEIGNRGNRSVEYGALDGRGSALWTDRSGSTWLRQGPEGVPIQLARTRWYLFKPASMTRDGSIGAWLDADGREVRFARMSGESIVQFRCQIDIHDHVTRLALSGTGSCALAGTEDGTIVRIRLQGDSAVEDRRWPGRQSRTYRPPVRAVAVDEDGVCVVAGTLQGEIFVGTLDTDLEKLQHVHSDYVSALAVACNPMRIVSGAANGEVLFWREGFRTGPVRAATVSTQLVRSVAFDPSLRWVAAVGADDWLRIYDFETGGLISGLKIFDQHPRACAFSADGRSIFVLHPEPGAPRTYRVEFRGLWK